MQMLPMTHTAYTTLLLAFVLYEHMWSCLSHVASEMQREY